MTERIRFLSLPVFRYMKQIGNITFVRDAHIKKFKKLMKYDLQSELANLRYEGRGEERNETFSKYLSV